jgi:hypothetical protein
MIQREQFTDKASAEGLLLDFIRDTFDLDVATVELRPLAVSLNSFNGFLTLTSGRRLFFKTHTEPGAVISEFYNAELLLRAEYPTLRPLYSSVDAGQQLLIYDVVEDPSVFDVARRIEQGDVALQPSLVAAQIEADQRLMTIYRSTLAWQDADEAAESPVHQLFSHRLTGERMRLGYGPAVEMTLPGTTVSMSDLRRLTWTVNGRRYDVTLDQMIADSTRLLAPAQPGPSVIGHGDAHNGNLFLRRDGGGLVYFDPAFGGRHDPLLDLAKPLFHNTFAMWMYFPDQVASDLDIRYRIDSGRIEVEHDYEPHPIRWFFLDSKMTNVVEPLLHELRYRGWLSEHWRPRLKAALFCCPLLTKSLSDRSAYPPEIALLGLAYAVEMCGSGEGSALDRVLDRVTPAE